MQLWDWVAWGLLAAWLWQLWPVWWWILRPRSIVQVPLLPASDPEPPFVSVIVAARDEAAAIEACLRRLVALDYPRYELIAVDDRSSDGTGAIMDRVAAEHARCRVIHLTELPPGWLGKNHACQRGAALACGEYLLFTDGDVLFEASVLRRAVSAMRRGALDHLVLLPGSPPAGFWYAVVMSYFAFLFTLGTKLPLARFRWARNAYVGVGAFNMVRREAYDRIGGHERLRLEVADDVMLGKLIKRAGLKEDVMIGVSVVTVRWQVGVRGIVRGLEKNAFAATRYSIAFTAVAVIAPLVFVLVPLVLMVTGPARLPFGIMVAMTLATLIGCAILGGFPATAALFYPVGAVLFAYAILRSAFITLRQGGVRWRDTFYPLAELRGGKI